jgi:very-short-patch-repair endonuclease
VLGDLAARQHGVLARRQLLAAGLSERMVDGRMRAGRLVRLHRGVYAVGHRQLRREGHWLAAVLAIGPGAVLSHREAAALYEIRGSNRPKIDVTTTCRGRLDAAGITVNRVRTLDSADITVVAGIPVTSVARTLVDLAGVVGPESLAKALNEAERLRLLDVKALQAARARTRGRRGPGHAHLAKALAELEAHGTTLTRSPLEVAFQTLVRQAGLPMPHTNVHIEGHEVDACWPAHNLAVELDGWHFHSSRHAFERDRARDRELTAKGYRVARFTHHEVAHRPGHVVEALRRLGL